MWTPWNKNASINPNQRVFTTTHDKCWDMTITIPCNNCDRYTSNCSECFGSKCLEYDELYYCIKDALQDYPMALYIEGIMELETGTSRLSYDVSLDNKVLYEYTSNCSECTYQAIEERIYE